MAFDIKGVSRPTVTAEFKPHENIADGEGIQTELNLDWLTLDRMEESESEYLNLSEEDLKQIEDGKLSTYHFMKRDIRYRSRVLGGKPGSNDPEDRVIRSWNVVRDGVPVPIQYETFLSLPYVMLANLFQFCAFDAGKPTKKKEDQSEDI